MIRGLEQFAGMTMKRFGYEPIYAEQFREPTSWEWVQLYLRDLWRW